MLCQTEIYFVMIAVAGYLTRIEAEVAAAGFGFQRDFRRRAFATGRFIEATTTLLWILALAAALFVWWTFEPAAMPSG